MVRERPDGPRLPADEVRRLSGDLARASAERDALMHLLLRTNATLLGRLARRWADFTRAHTWADRWISRPSRLAWLVLTLRWPAGLRVNPLFDEAWYRDEYPDAPAGRRAAYRQYLRFSMSKGRDPNPHFDTDWYLERNPDVAKGHWHPLDHYLYFGWRETRDPSAGFDGFDYLRHHPDAAVRAENPLLHAMRAGPPKPGDLSDPFDPGSPRLPGAPPVVHRTLTHYRRYGVRRTVSRAAAELGIGGSSPQEPVDRVGADVDAGRIKAHLDTPRPGATEGTSALLVSGWAFSDRPILEVAVHLDGERVTDALHGHVRQDVAALHRNPDAADCGFSARVPLDGTRPGRHAVQVVIRDEGGAVRELGRRFVRIEPESTYHHYYRRSLSTDEEVNQLRAKASDAGVPNVHVLLLDGEPEDLARTIRSLEGQDYSALTWSAMTKSDTALPASPDPARLVGILRAGETLTPVALWTIAAHDDVAAADLVYADHDAVEETGRHVRPWFVPDWAPDHLLAQDYVGGFYLVPDTDSLRTLLLELDRDEAGAWRYRLLLELGSEARRVVHIPTVLWSAPADREDHRDRAEQEVDAVYALLTQEGRTAAVETIEDGSNGPIRRIAWPLPEQPRVSVIIPTTGRLELVSRTMENLHERTDYPDLETIVIDNSRGKHPDGIALLRRQEVTVLERDEPFNWARLNNAGARAASGELLLFLNDDLEVTDPDWLTLLVRQALRPEVGVVGPALTYPDGRIQHAGVFLVGHGGGAVHLFHGVDPASGPYLDLHRVQREVTAVTGACMLVPHRLFTQLDGFDEELAVVGNDIDLCLRAARTGHRVVYEPGAVLIHEESASRSSVDHTPDEGRVWERWSGTLVGGDPHYNPNLSQRSVEASLDWERLDGRRDPLASADPASGLNLVGYLRAELGVGEAVRGEARALTEAGIPFVAIDVRLWTAARMEDSSWTHVIAEEPVFGTNLLHVNADLLPRVLGELPDGLTHERRNIGYWTWELPEFPAQWRGSFALVDEVWVPSTFVHEAIAADAPVPVHVVPHAIRKPRGPFLGRERFGLPEEGAGFLAMYDTQSVIERKNPQAAVEAYVRAFPTPADGAFLVLKVNTAGERELGPLRRRIAGRDDVYLITDVLSRRELDSLMAACDVFVSLHRSEGFGLPVAECMALGKAVIVTAWSGNMDFTSEHTAALIGYELVTLQRAHGPYPAGSRWAEPDVDQAAEWMRRLRDDEGERQQLGQAAAQAIAESNSAAAVGAIIAERLGQRGRSYAYVSRSTA